MPDNAADIKGLEARLNETIARMEQMEMAAAQNMQPAMMPESWEEDGIPTWIHGGITVLPSHPWKVNVDSGLDVDVESGYVYGLWDGDFKITAAAASFTLADDTTNKIYLRLEIGADAPDSPLSIPGTDSNGDAHGISYDEWWHLLLSATILAGTSIPASTWSFRDETAGYKYIEIAEVVTASGVVTSIYQRLHSDIIAVPTAGIGWIDF